MKHTKTAAAVFLLAVMLLCPFLAGISAEAGTVVGNMLENQAPANCQKAAIATVVMLAAGVAVYLVRNKNE
ncbi:hypothetical protein [Murimonas intestini]|uniref:Uncharacterized protein n=1 Tax=Murimonas intestini TaxID=1337051 RepID=A0AB73T736_9FIRM|nr:hypothetical protein [Murimonas intestini]MCR1839618.1 hypothetical protein [Murimonas intestini]MCR1866461.1 hypothetical protein [Murimonas intestini]MCR1882421.1 hypothetical protein [Murimonas intestini]